MSIEITIIYSPENVNLGQKSYHFPDEGGTLGRGANNFWVLEDPNKYMSSVHAQISSIGAQYYLTDVSTNGTFVNGAFEPLGNGNQVQLNEGDKFTISDYEFVVKLSNALSATADPFADFNPAVAPSLNNSPSDDFFSEKQVNDPFASLPSASPMENDFLSDDFFSDKPSNAPFASTTSNNDDFSTTSFNGDSGHFDTNVETDPLAILNKGNNDSLLNNIPASQPLGNILPNNDFLTESPAQNNQVVNESIEWPKAHAEKSSVIPDNWGDDFGFDNLEVPVNTSPEPLATGIPASDPFAGLENTFASAPPAAEPLATGTPASDPFAGLENTFTQATSAVDPFAGLGDFAPATPSPDITAAEPVSSAAPAVDPFAGLDDFSPAAPVPDITAAEPVSSVAPAVDPFAGLGDFSPAAPAPEITAAEPVSSATPAVDPFAGLDDFAQTAPAPEITAAEPVSSAAPAVDPFAGLDTFAQATPIVAKSPILTEPAPESASGAPLHSDIDYANLEKKNQQLAREVAALKMQLANVKPAHNATDNSVNIDALNSVVDAMGLSKWNLDDSKKVQINNMVGLLMRETMQGMMKVLTFRKKIKEEFRINVTTIQSVENNPLKFSANIDDALENMFIKENNAYKAPIDAIREGFEGIAEHQVSVIAGMQAAFRGMIDRFDPIHLESRFEKYKSPSLLRLGSKTKQWNAYKEYHKGLVDNLDDSFQNLFGYDFVQAYEEQMQRLITEKMTTSTNKKTV